MLNSNLENNLLPNKKLAKNIPKLSSIFAFIVSCIVVIGWAFNIDIFKTGAIGIATMKANTAICFVLAGISLWFLPSSRKIATGYAIALLFISSLTLCQYLFNFNIGIDELLFRDAPISPATSHPGRMGLNTAFNFLLLGLALLLLEPKNKPRKIWKVNAIALAQGLTAIAFLIALQALIGYAYEVRIFSQLSIYTSSMASHTALTFIVLCIGLFCVSTDIGLVGTFTSKLSGGTVARRSLTGVMLSPLIFGWLIAWGLRANLYDPFFAISLLVILLFITSLLLLWQSAKYLNRVDKKRQDTEIALKESEERLKLALQGAGQGIWDWDLKTQELIWDERCKQIFGLPSEIEVTYEWHLNALHSDDKQRVFEAAAIALREHGEFQEEYRTFWPDGTMRWVFAKGRGFYDATNEPYRMSGTVLDITERKDAELASRRNEERLQKMVETAQIGIAFGSSTGEIYDTNNAFLEMIGWTRQEVLTQGLNWRNISPPEYTQIDDEAIIQLQETGYVRQCEKELICQDGSRIPILINATRLDGERDEHVVFIINLTETKKMQALLAKSEQRLRFLADAIPHLIWVIGPSNQPIFSNQKFQEYCGLSFAEGVKYNWSSLVLAEDLENVQNIWREAQKTGSIFEVEFRMRRAVDGEFRWHLSRAIPIKNQAGEIFEWVGTNTDIHDLKKTTADLALQKQKYKYIFDAVGVAIWEEDFSQVKVALDKLKTQGIQDFKQYFADHPDFVDWAIGAVKILNVNDISLQLFATEDKQQLLTSLHQIFLPETREIFIQELLTIVTGEIFFASETVVKNLQGEKLDILFTIKFPPPTENYQCVLVTLVDIGERIKLEQNLQQKLEELTRANRVKDEFLAVLSHELRTPLNPILGWIKLLQKGNLTPAKTTEAFNAIERNVKLQLNLVEDLLDIERILHGKIRLEIQPVDLALVIEAAIETVNFSAKVKSIDIQYNILSAASVMGDKNRLQQVFWNLLSNAIKFTPKGGRVEVGLSSVNNYARVNITDTGIGISPEFLPHIYEYFRQADGSSTRKFGGLGLGLTIVKYLLEIHGGTIEATSPGTGQGATFTVMLPLMPCLLTNVYQKEADDILPSLEGIKVVVVDDEQDNLELITFALENSGASVISFNSGAAALRAISENAPDILVSDISMPGMDGYSLLQELLKLENACCIPSIALTAYADDASREQILAAGFKYYLAKPVDPYELVRVVADCVRARGNGE